MPDLQSKLSDVQWLHDQLLPSFHVHPLLHPRYPDFASGPWQPHMVVRYLDGRLVFEVPSQDRQILLVERVKAVLELGDVWSGFLSQRVSASGLGSVVIHLGDGFAESTEFDADAKQLAFCVERSLPVSLLPDPYALRFARKIHCNQTFRPLGKDNAWRAFLQRVPQIGWRGSVTGEPRGRIAGELDALRNLRVRFVSGAKSASHHIDARITAVPAQASTAEKQIRNLLQRLDGYAEPVPEEWFHRFQGYVDLDGNTSAWGTIFKYWGLNLVLKPESVYRLAYYDRLVPGINYLPVPVAEPLEAARLFSGLTVQDKFEIAYEGHLMACGYLADIAGAAWRPGISGDGGIS